MFGLLKEAASLNIASPDSFQCLKPPFEPFTSPWIHPCYNKPRVSRPKFRLETNSTVVWPITLKKFQPMSKGTWQDSKIVINGPLTSYVQDALLTEIRIFKVGSQESAHWSNYNFSPLFLNLHALLVIPQFRKSQRVHCKGPHATGTCEVFKDH